VTCKADPGQVCGTLTDYCRPNGAAYAPKGIERGCFGQTAFPSNPGCSAEFDIKERNETVCTCTRSCNTDYCNNWTTSPSPK